jgi:hypothetical protein
VGGLEPDEASLLWLLADGMAPETGFSGASAPEPPPKYHLGGLHVKPVLELREKPSQRGSKYVVRLRLAFSSLAPGWRPPEEQRPEQGETEDAVGARTTWWRGRMEALAGKELAVGAGIRRGGAGARRRGGEPARRGGSSKAGRGAGAVWREAHRLAGRGGSLRRVLLR